MSAVEFIKEQCVRFLVIQNSQGIITPMLQNKASLKKYQQRWDKVAAIERQEIKNLSLEKKFQKMVSLFNLARALGWDLNKDREKDVQQVRARWVFLKKGY